MGSCCRLDDQVLPLSVSLKCFCVVACVYAARVMHDVLVYVCSCVQGSSMVSDPIWG
jgi:hypothetical protein